MVFDSTECFYVIEDCGSVWRKPRLYRTSQRSYVACDETDCDRLESTHFDKCSAWYGYYLDRLYLMRDMLIGICDPGLSGYNVDMVIAVLKQAKYAWSCHVKYDRRETKALIRSGKAAPSESALSRMSWWWRLRWWANKDAVYRGMGLSVAGND